MLLEMTLTGLPRLRGGNSPLLCESLDEAESDVPVDRRGRRPNSHTARSTSRRAIHGTGMWLWR